MIPEFLKNDKDLTGDERGEMICRLVNQGYTLGLSVPMEFKDAMNTKIAQLAKETEPNGRWEAIELGFGAALNDRQKIRKIEIAKVKKSKRMSGLGRSKN
jgi:hypothetical protein